MPTLKELQDALVAADRAASAGDAGAQRDAQVLADHIHSLSKTQPQTMRLSDGRHFMPSLDMGDVGISKGLVMGAGRSIDRLSAGLQQAYYGLRGSQDKLNALAQDQEITAKAYEQFQKKAPGSTGIGETLPATAASMLVGNPSGVVGTALAAGAAAGVPELLSYGSLEDRLKAGGKAALISGGVAGGLSAAGRAITPLATSGRASDDVLEAAKRIGVDLSVGDKTKNRAVQSFENYLAQAPGSAGAFQQVKAGNQSAINQFAAKSIGANSDNLSANVLDQAGKRIGGEYSRLQSGMAVDTTHPAYINSLMRADAIQSALGPKRISAIDKEITDGLDLISKGSLTGEAYQRIRSIIGGDAKSAFQGNNATLGRALSDIQSGLDDAAKAALSGADAKAMDLANKQYAAWKTLTKGMVAEAGDISPARVAAALRQDGPGFRLGRSNSDLVDLGKLGEGIKSYANPTSGQSPGAQMLMQSGLLGSPAIPMNYLAGGLMTSPKFKAYMTNGLLGDQSQEWLRRAAIQAGIGAAENKKR